MTFWDFCDRHYIIALILGYAFIAGGWNAIGYAAQWWRRGQPVANAGNDDDE